MRAKDALEQPQQPRADGATGAAKAPTLGRRRAEREQARHRWLGIRTAPAAPARTATEQVFDEVSGPPRGRPARERPRSPRSCASAPPLLATDSAMRNGCQGRWLKDRQPPEAPSRPRWRAWPMAPARRCARATSSCGWRSSPTPNIKQDHAGLGGCGRARDLVSGERGHVGDGDEQADAEQRGETSPCAESAPTSATETAGERDDGSVAVRAGHRRGLRRDRHDQCHTGRAAIAKLPMAWSPDRDRAVISGRPGWCG